MSDDVEAAYSAPWPVPESKAGILAFPGLVPISPDHPDTPAHQAVREQLGRWEKPALVLFSDSDPIFSVRAGARIAAHIPGALEPETVKSAGHFLQDDQGEEIGRRIARFVAG
jgi:haloalkane dehalogenase